MNIQARLKQAEERAMLLQKKADTIHLIMVKPVPGKERLYIISYILKLDNIRSLDMIWGCVRASYEYQIKKEQEAEKNGKM